MRERHLSGNRSIWDRFRAGSCASGEYEACSLEHVLYVLDCSYTVNKLFVPWHYLLTWSVILMHLHCKQDRILQGDELSIKLITSEVVAFACFLHRLRLRYFYLVLRYLTYFENRSVVLLPNSIVLKSFFVPNEEPHDNLLPAILLCMFWMPITLPQHFAFRAIIRITLSFAVCVFCFQGSRWKSNLCTSSTRKVLE